MTNIQETNQIPWVDTDRLVYSSGERVVKTCTVEQEGFQCRIDLVIDSDYDWLQGRGRFTDTYVAEAIHNPGAKWDRNLFQYFVPEQSAADRVASLLQWRDAKTGELLYPTMEDAVAEAQRQILEDCLIAANPEEMDCTAYGVIVTASLAGVELAQDSLWGIEMGPEGEESYLDICGLDCLAEAVEDAHKKAKQLLRTMLPEQPEQ